MIQYPHWASNLQVGDRCLATIRHESDGTKNHINVPIIICRNDINKCNVIGLYEGFMYHIPYNELTTNKQS